MLFLIVFALVLCILSIAYPDRWILTSPRHDLPGPKGIPLFGNLFQFYPWRAKAVQWMEYILPCYHDLLTVTMPPWGRAIVIGRPEWLAHVKSVDMTRYSRGKHEVDVFTEFPGSRTPVASDGPDWRHYRRAMAPIFTVKSFSSHVQPAIHKVMGTVCSLLTNAAVNKTIIDWNDVSGRIALSIFCISSLSLETGVLREDLACLESSDKLRDALVVLNTLSSRRLMNPFWRWTEKARTIFSRGKFTKARTYIRNLIFDIVSERQASSPDNATSDYVSALLEDPQYNDPILVRDTLVTLLFAGRDNTQNALAWSMHALLQKPEWMYKMVDEAENLNRGQEPNSIIPYSRLGEYHIHHAVFYEVIRLWPGLPKNLRRAIRNDVLPSLPDVNLPEVKINQGDYILWSDYYMMRHPQIWGADAAVFNPTRHIDANGQFIKPKAPNFHAFGAGPRLCPAAQLVTYEFIACWSVLLTNFSFAARYEKHPQMMEAFTPALDSPLHIQINTK
ncbi:cytochrome P450, partial [Mycena rebaudengoi]